MEHFEYNTLLFSQTYFMYIYGKQFHYGIESTCMYIYTFFHKNETTENTFSISYLIFSSHILLLSLEQ